MPDTIENYSIVGIGFEIPLDFTKAFCHSYKYRRRGCARTPTNTHADKPVKTKAISKGSIHKHYEVEELKLTIRVLLCSLSPSNYYFTTIDCLKELIRSIDNDDEYVYNLPSPVPVNALHAGKFRKLLDSDEYYCSEHLDKYVLENMLELGLVTRFQVEHPGGIVCLHTGLKNVFYVDETINDDPESQYTYINDEGEIINYLGCGGLAWSFHDETELCFPESRKVRQLLDGLGVAKREIRLICFPHLQCQGDKIVIVAFRFIATIGEYESFNERTDTSISFHHVLEEAIGVASRCGGCGKKLPMDANFVHCAKETKKRKVEDNEE